MHIEPPSRLTFKDDGGGGRRKQEKRYGTSVQNAHRKTLLIQIRIWGRGEN